MLTDFEAQTALLDLKARRSVKIPDDALEDLLEQRLGISRDKTDKVMPTLKKQLEDILGDLEDTMNDLQSHIFTLEGLIKELPLDAPVTT